MKLISNQRRRFIKVGLTVPLLSTIPIEKYGFISSACVMPGDYFFVPENIQSELFMLYGGYANSITNTDRLILNAPDIAENGAVVGINEKGEKGLVMSMAIFIAQNLNPLSSTCTLHAGADLAVGLRVKIAKTSDIYVVAKTVTGLISVMKKVKVTIGCGGG